MSVPAARKAVPAVVRDGLAAWTGRAQVVSVAQKLMQRHEQDLRNAEAEAGRKAGALGEKPDVKMSFSFHLGADIKVPTNIPPPTQNTAAKAQEVELADANPFAGLPLQAWAERLGERVMPAYELVKQEQKKAKTNPKPLVSAPVSYAVPHLLPFTRWAANNASIRETFVAEEAKTRKRARMSWYHPDDTMVPRGWFKGGLLEDMKYYSPFKSDKSSSQSPTD